MQAIALALAFGLALGPAATEVDPAPAAEVEAAAQSEPAAELEPLPDLLPDVTEPEAVEPGEAAPNQPATAPEQAPQPVPPATDEQALAASTSAAAEPAPAVVHDRLGCDGAPRCRRMTIAGIVVGTLGFGGVGAGIGLLVNKDKVIPESPTFVTSTRPAGLVMLTVSSGVAFTAVLMLVAAHKGYKDRPDDQARIQLTPTGLRF